MELAIVILGFIIFICYLLTRHDYMESIEKKNIVPGLTYTHIDTGKEVLVTFTGTCITWYVMNHKEYSMNTRKFMEEFELKEE